MKKRPHLGGVAALALALLAATGAATQAQDSAADAIKYRQTVMKTLSGHLGALAAIAKGEVSFTIHAAPHAQAILDITEMMPDLFAANTGPDSGVENRALAAI